MKTLDWTDIHDIAISLEEHHPQADVIHIRFTDLMRWILELPGFQGRPERCNEKILEAVQAAWLEERD
jgi:FeS assembly protein IscX